MKPYGIVSDQHFHKWTQFSSVLPSGVNSRLQASLDELKRCAYEVHKAGGNLIVNAGDTFHQRGVLSPEVLNPVMDIHRELIEDGFRVIIDAGNHDLEGKEATRLGSAITALEGIGCEVINERFFYPAHGVALIPWISSIEELKKVINDFNCGDRSRQDLVIHAPIDNVIPGLPDHGLTADWLAKQGFRRVFSGHYHNHKDFKNGVYSIGATAHQTWSDVNSKAGFLIVSEDEVKWFKSHAPEFIDLTGEMDPDEVPLIVDGNFVRAKISSTKTQDINKLREWLEDCGAKGVLIQAVKEPTKARSGSVTSSVSAGASIEVSIAEYVKTQTFDYMDQVQIECQKILAELGV